MLCCVGLPFFLSSYLSIHDCARVCTLVMKYGNETEEEGVVYPGEVEVRVDYPGDLACSGVTADDISCTVNIYH